MSMALVSALCVLATGCLENPTDRLLALELEQARIIIDNSSNCDAMGIRLRQFFTENGQEMRGLYQKVKARGESLGTDDSRYTDSVSKTLHDAHNARKACRGRTAAAGYGPQFIELL